MREYTIDDLENGYLVKFKNGDLGVLTHSHDGDVFILESDDFLPLELMTHSMTCYSNPDYNIEEIYDYVKLNECSIDGIYSTYNRNLIWKRENIRELTIEEIEYLMGCKIKIVGGK